MSPEKTKAALAGAALGSGQKATEDFASVQPSGDKRNDFPRQASLPIVAGLLFVGGPSRKTADIQVPDCEQCGQDHRHTCPLPPPALTRTKTAECGARYQIVPKRFRATRRGRKAA
ncbi:hypothetical protein Nocox_36950 [Nonomuraea coxensis DSM 45129]|uniref:Uncharacterized protein n=1 Tax=Nonomuraea coxensis DSM 45129 TaxID=1122611 RepID=A0ABX8UB16_9ACTN|nr:hypothetical protein [Nonomuraea coxensis]QYC44944.1 hypothetical protein Nocox_36950 [Nonomuraea coxensis DSM 45129]